MGLFDFFKKRYYQAYLLNPGVVDDIRQATNGNFVLGSERFKKEIATALGGRRITPGKSGRLQKRPSGLDKYFQEKTVAPIFHSLV